MCLATRADKENPRDKVTTVTESVEGSCCQLMSGSRTELRSSLIPIPSTGHTVAMSKTERRHSAHRRLLAKAVERGKEKDLACLMWDERLGVTLRWLQ